MNDRERIAAVERLIALADPLPVCRERIAGCAWDYHGVPALLTRADIARILRRYLADELTAADVEGWADAVECRDDIEYDAPDLDEISDLLTILSNPAIYGPLTKAAAREMLGWWWRLGRDGRDGVRSAVGLEVSGQCRETVSLN